jgi:hypothetical protein
MLLRVWLFIRKRFANGLRMANCEPLISEAEPDIALASLRLISSYVIEKNHRETTIDRVTD